MTTRWATAAAALLLAGVLARAAEPEVPLTDCYGDPLPAGALVRLGTVRFRHPEDLTSVAYSPDGTAIASADDGGNVRLWEAATGKPRLHVSVPGVHRLRLAFSPDGKALAAGGDDKVVRVWDAATGKELLQFAGHEGTVAALAFSPDGKTLAAGGFDGLVHLWDVATGKEQAGLSGEKTRVFSLAFAPDGLSLAVGDASGVRVREVATGKEQVTLPRLGTWPHSVAFSPDGKALAVGDRNGRVGVWDLPGGRQRWRCADGWNHVEAVAFSPDGKTVAGADGGPVRLWDAVTGKERPRPFGDGNVRGTSLAYSPDGKTLAIAGEDQVVRLWDLVAGEDRTVSSGHVQGVRRVVFSPDGTTLATVGADGAARLWDAQTGKGRGVLPTQGDHVASLAFAPDGKTLATTGWLPGGRAEYRIVLWDAATRKELSQFLTDPARPREIVYAGGHKLLSLSDGMSAIEWDPVTGKRLRDYTEVDGLGLCLALAPDAKTLAVGGAAGETDGSIRGFVSVLDRTSGKALFSAATSGTHVRELAYSPEGHLLASLGDDHTVQLWHVAARKERYTIGEPAAKALGLTFANDGRALALGCADGTVRLYETATGKERYRFQGPAGKVFDVRFAPDGRTLASASWDTTALVWAVPGHGGKVLPSPLTDKELAAAWDDLAAADAGRAYRAMVLLAAGPKQTVALCQQELHPAAVPDPKRLARLLIDLDAGEFADREKASAELAALGELAGPALRDLLKGSPSPEARRRAAAVLAKLDGPLESPETLRAVRAVEALELAGTADARRLLERLAEGTAEARLTQEAKAAAGRLAGRSSIP
jgi:WD40 repeat protein